MIGIKTRIQEHKGMKKEGELTEERDNRFLGDEAMTIRNMNTNDNSGL
jgi:hypothetical protein